LGYPLFSVKGSGLTVLVALFHTQSAIMPHHAWERSATRSMELRSHCQKRFICVLRQRCSDGTDPEVTPVGVSLTLAALYRACAIWRGFFGVSTQEG
jgi:hypothetical protein